MNKHNAVVGIFDAYLGLPAVIKELHWSGFEINHLSIVGKDYHSEAKIVGRYNAGDQVKIWSRLGEFWGGLSGLLFGSAFHSIAGIGPVIVFGPMAGWIVTALEGGVEDSELSALGAGLFGAGISKNRIAEYEAALKADKFLLIAHGTADEMTRANGILRTIGTIALPSRQRESQLSQSLAIDVEPLAAERRSVQKRLRRART